MGSIRVARRPGSEQARKATAPRTTGTRTNVAASVGRTPNSRPRMTGPSANEPARPLGRMGTSEEIAGMVAYLAGADAGFVTGASMTIDGGYVA